jgi:hypothetical protein
MSVAASLLAFSALVPGAASAQMAAHSPPSASAPLAAPAAALGTDGLARCERAVRQALVPASRAAEVRFAAAPTVSRALSGNDQVVLHGEGQWRDAGAMRGFTYRCSLDPHSTEAVGVVIRQTGARSMLPAEPQRIEEPDLSHLSPSACESSAAVAVKRRWPRASKIAFDTTTRSLTQQSAARAELHGQGRAQPAPESRVLVHFGFDCAIDPRDGRVIEVRLGD